MRWRTGPAGTVTAANLGVPGYTTNDLLDQLRNDANARQEVASADILIVIIGANDLGDAFDSWNQSDCDATCYQPQVDAMGTRLASVLHLVRSLRAGQPMTVLVDNYWNVFTDGAVARADGGQEQLDWSAEVTTAANRAIANAANNSGDLTVDLVKPFKTGGEDSPRSWPTTVTTPTQRGSGPSSPPTSPPRGRSSSPSRHTDCRPRGPRDREPGLRARRSGALRRRHRAAGDRSPSGGGRRCADLWVAAVGGAALRRRAGARWPGIPRVQRRPPRPTLCSSWSRSSPPASPSRRCSPSSSSARGSPARRSSPLSRSLPVCPPRRQRRAKGPAPPCRRWSACSCSGWSQPCSRSVSSRVACASSVGPSLLAVTARLRLRGRRRGWRGSSPFHQELLAPRARPCAMGSGAVRR